MHGVARPGNGSTGSFFFFTARLHVKPAQHHNIRNMSLLYYLLLPFLLAYSFFFSSSLLVLCSANHEKIYCISFDFCFSVAGFTFRWFVVVLTSSRATHTLICARPSEFGAVAHTIKLFASRKSK